MKLHHIGKVVGDIDEAVSYYRETLGLEPIGDKVIDPIQKVEVISLDAGLGNNVTIELIHPITEDSPVNKFLKSGGGLHHLSFQVRDIQLAIEELRTKGALVLGKIVPSAGHDNIPSVWIYTRSKELIELMEIKES